MTRYGHTGKATRKEASEFPGKGAEGSDLARLPVALACTCNADVFFSGGLVADDVLNIPIPLVKPSLASLTKSAFIALRSLAPHRWVLAHLCSCGRGLQEQQYMARSWWKLLQDPVVEIDSQMYHGYIVSDKAMKVRMLHCELKWEIPVVYPS